MRWSITYNDVAGALASQSHFRNAFFFVFYLDFECSNDHIQTLHIGHWSIRGPILQIILPKFYQW